MDDKHTVIYCDREPAFPAEHLSDDQLERLCMTKGLASPLGEMHLAFCLTCTERAQETTEFVSAIRLALTSGRI